ncbi:MAG: SRPBCC family protein [Amphiplicatus sp.]
MTDDNPLELVISRKLDAPRALLWKAWSEKAHIEEWWCPKPWRAEFTGFDLRPGGAFDSVMRGPNGERHDHGGVILDLVPAERLVFTDLLLAGWRPAPQPFLGFAAIITMEDEGAGTRYTARVLHRNAEDAKKHVEMGFYDGWNVCISQLESYARTL